MLKTKLFMTLVKDSKEDFIQIGTIMIGVGTTAKSMGERLDSEYHKEKLRIYNPGAGTVSGWKITEKKHHG